MKLEDIVEEIEFKLAYNKDTGVITAKLSDDRRIKYDNAFAFFSDLSRYYLNRLESLDEYFLKYDMTTIAINRFENYMYNFREMNPNNSPDKIVQPYLDYFAYLRAEFEKLSDPRRLNKSVEKDLTSIQVQLLILYYTGILDTIRSDSNKSNVAVANLLSKLLNKSSENIRKPLSNFTKDTYPSKFIKKQHLQEAVKIFKTMKWKEPESKSQQDLDKLD